MRRLSLNFYMTLLMKKTTQLHIYLGLIFLISQSFSQLTDPPDGPLRPVAEFERSQGVMVAYPYGFGIPASFIADMSQDVTVYVLVESYLQTNAEQELQAAGANMEHVEVVTGALDSIWIQDYGPYFVVDGNHEMVVVDFEYNRPRPFDNQVPARMCDFLDVAYFDSDIVHNGGNLMFDGYFTAAASTIVYTENPTIDVDQRMADYYGATFHMTQPDPTGNYHEHINCWAKFLSPEKIIVREVPPSHFYYNQIEAVAAYYAETLNCFGEPYKVYRVYTPNDEPYANSFILNDKVYIPVSGGQWDDEAIASFSAALPGYDVIGINYWDWLPTDALHCRVQALPDLEMLQMFHNPINNQEFPLDEYEFTLTLDDLSETGIISDSIRVFWKNHLMDDYDAVQLTQTDEYGEYLGAIPPQPIDTEVWYYLTAADSSGRSERLPIAGYYAFETPGGTPAMPGDINQDGSLNVMDIVMIVNHIVNIEYLTGYALYLADLDDNDIVNILDIIIILNLIVAG